MAANGILYDECRKYIAAHMMERATQMAVGDGGHDEALKSETIDPSAHGLVSELMRKPIAVKTQEDLFSFTATIRIEKGDLNGEYISEYILFDADGIPIGGKTSAPKIKESDEYYDFSIKVKF